MVSDEKRNIKRTLNHLNYVSRIAGDIVEKPMSIVKMYEEIKRLDKQANLARRRIIHLFNENLDLSDKLELEEEYGML